MNTTEQNLEQATQNQEEVTEVPELSSGYIVGVEPNGAFYFKLLGKENSLTQMMGLHAYAGHRVELAKEINQGYGFPVLAQQNSQLLEILKQMATSLKNLESKSESKIITP